MPELPLAELLRPELSELAAYAPTPGEFAVRLDANEAPPLLDAAAREKLARAAAETAWERYPDARQSALRAAIARRSGVTPEEVVVGVGSDEVIALLLTVLSRPRGGASVPTLLTTTPTFVMYRLSAKVRGQRVIEVPLDAQWDLSLPAMKRALEMAPPNLVFVATPNNPTGTRPSLEALDELITACDGALVVLDEAYVDYADGDCLELYRRHENVALLRTLSKVGFASLRIGWLLARPALIAELDKARLPYNVTSLSQRLGTLVLSELSSDLDAVTRAVIAERERLTAALRELPGLEPTPSQANFVWVRTERPSGELFDALAQRGILVRSFHPRGGRLTHQLRISVGTRDENDTLLAALTEILNP